MTQFTASACCIIKRASMASICICIFKELVVKNLWYDTFTRVGLGVTWREIAVAVRSDNYRKGINNSRVIKW